MRIAFIVSSLEPGRDGVGDYTRRLAAECNRQGHPIVILALNDVRVLGDALFESQEVEGISVSVLRLPSDMALSERVTTARRWLGSFKPDWISLQFVCYGYHPKGLAWRWSRVFAELGTLATHRHLMFHELWIGEEGYSTSWRRLIGVGQRFIIRNMHQRFNPDIATTSMSLFQRRLAYQGITTRVLPLFGNFPLVPRDDDRIAGLLRDVGSQIVRKPRMAFLNGIFVGGVHPDFDTGPLIQWLKELKSQATKPLLLSLVGRTGPAGQRLVRQLTSSLPDEFEAILVGEQPAQIISQALQFADFGINTGSPEFLGKSGTFAAMQEHELPVVLADGGLDPALLQDNCPAVLQFSSSDSTAAVLERQVRRHEVTGVIRTATDLIRLFEKKAPNPSERGVSIDRATNASSFKGIA